MRIVFDTVDDKVKAEVYDDFNNLLESYTELPGGEGLLKVGKLIKNSEVYDIKQLTEKIFEFYLEEKNG